MSARALAWAWQQQPKTTSEKLVLAALADRADDDGECFPSLAWLASKCAPMPAATVKRIIASLAKQGLLTKVERRRRGDGQLGTWLYQLPLDGGATAHPCAVDDGEPPRTGEPSIEPPEDLSVEPDGSTAALAVVEPAQTAQTLVAQFVDDAGDLDLPVSRRVIGQVAKYVGELLEEGHSYERVQAGLTLMLSRGQVKPALLGNFMLEAALPERRPPPQRRYGRGVRGDELGDLQEQLEREGR